MLPDPVVELLRRQRGLAAHHQIRLIEPNPTARRAVYRHPDLDVASPRVLRHRAAAPCPEQDLLLGVLDAGPDALLWGKSGACHWGYSRFRLLPPHVAVRRRNVKGDRLAQIHALRHFDAIDRTVHADVPVARPETILLWLAGMWTHRFGHELAERWTAVAIDQAWRQRLVSGPYIHDLAAQSGGKGRSGIVVLRAVLEQRPPDYQPAGSRLEERFENVVGAAARQLDRQVTVDAETAIRTVDYRARPWPLVIEINGEAFHTSLTDRAADRERYDRLLDLGFSVAVFWEYDIWHDAMTVQEATTRLVRTPDSIPTLHRPTKAPWQW